MFRCAEEKETGLKQLATYLGNTQVAFQKGYNFFEQLNLFFII
jgi:hypothetical protein